MRLAWGIAARAKAAKSGGEVQGAKATKIESTTVSVADLLAGEEAAMEAPLFQRHYVWGPKEWQPFWIDVVESAEYKSQRFLGAIVLHEKSSGSFKEPRVYWIVDGQQRVATVYVVLMALASHLLNRGNSDGAETIHRKYLTLRHQQGGASTLKFRPTLADIPDFKFLAEECGLVFADLAPHAKSSAGGKFMTCYRYFFEEIERHCSETDDFDGELDALVNAVVGGLDFIAITLGDAHDPIDVFDRLNARGEPLTLSEILKNAIFREMDLSTYDNNRVLELEHEVWTPFFNQFGSPHSADRFGDAVEKQRKDLFSQFVFPYVLTRDSSATKSTAIAALRRIWEADNRVVGNEGVQLVKARINDMRRYQPGLMAFSVGPPKEYAKRDELIARRYRSLARFHLPTVALPFFLSLDESWRSEDIDNKSMLKVLEIVESFLVRRAIVGLEPTGLHAIFKRLWSVSEQGKPELVRKGLQTGTIKFPSSREVKKVLKTEPFYARKKKAFVLYERELSIAKLETSVAPLNRNVEVDHLMPQNPKTLWEGVSQQEHDAHKDLCGNLMLLSGKENKLKGNRTWDETRRILRGDSGIIASLFAEPRHIVEKFSTWGPNEIKTRTSEIADWVATRWPEGPKGVERS